MLNKDQVLQTIHLANMRASPRLYNQSAELSMLHNGRELPAVHALRGCSIVLNPIRRRLDSARWIGILRLASDHRARHASRGAVQSFKGERLGSLPKEDGQVKDGRRHWYLCAERGVPDSLERAGERGWNGAASYYGSRV
jgi:hypothetical protein